MKILLQFLVLAVLAATAENAQVTVAVDDVGHGLSQAGLEIAHGAARAGTGVAIAAPDILATGETLALQFAAVGWGAGRIMIPPVAGAARDVSFAFAKAGWHLIIPKRDNSKPRYTEVTGGPETRTLVTAEALGADTVYSEDLSRGQRYGRIPVVNPFA